MHSYYNDYDHSTAYTPQLHLNYNWYSNIAVGKIVGKSYKQLSCWVFKTLPIPLTIALPFPVQAFPLQPPHVFPLAPLHLSPG